MSSQLTPDGAGLPRPRPIYKDFNVLQLGVLVFLLDQLSKYLVIQLLVAGASYPFRGFFRFTHVHNSGSAFGILQGQNTPLIFISFIGIIILVLIYRSQPYPSNWLRLSLGLQLGGAFGNLIDRLRLGFVTDFIDIGPWPVFNLADASIVTGLVLLAWVFTRSGPTPESSEASSAQAGEGVEAWDTTYGNLQGEPPPETGGGTVSGEQPARTPDTNAPVTGEPVAGENEPLAAPSELGEGQSGPPDRLQ